MRAEAVRETRTSSRHGATLESGLTTDEVLDVLRETGALLEGHFLLAGIHGDDQGALTVLRSCVSYRLR